MCKAEPVVVKPDLELRVGIVAIEYYWLCVAYPFVGVKYHKDIAGAHNIDLSKVQGGAFAGVGDNEVKVSGYSTQFGGVEDYRDEVLAYFESYFDCQVTVEV
jgi:hypothetical protein